MENEFWHWFWMTFPYLGVCTGLVFGYRHRYFIKDPDMGYLGFIAISVMTGLFYPFTWLGGILSFFNWRSLTPREKDLDQFEHQIKLKEWGKEHLNKIERNKLALEEQELDLTKRWVELVKDDPKQAQVILRTLEVADETLKLLDVDLDSELPLDADASNRTGTSQKPSSS